MKPALRITTESGCVYDVTDGHTHVRSSRKTYDPTSERVLHAHVWYPLVCLWAQVGHGMRLSLDGVPVLTTPVASIEGVE